MKSIYNKPVICAICAILPALLVLGCSDKNGENVINFEYPVESLETVKYPDLRFAVISDLHLYAPSLGSSGAAFEKAMNSDRKLMLDSIDLLDFAIDPIIESGVSFVLISGDLTKDGELINHEIVSQKLKAFNDAGISVYVVPGNHDVNNPDAVSYSGSDTAPVSNINAGDFARIYGDYGYNAALMRDDDSLSYVAELTDGLWLLALDACRYRENEHGKGEIVSGKISQRTADWIAAMLQTAMNHDKAVIALMHHGVVEHWPGQSKLHPDYLVEGYKEFGKFLAAYNVRLVFTGHYHAQDITLGQYDDKFIYDVMTGSLVTSPCPIRYVELNNNYLNIITETIADKIHPGTDFADNAGAIVRRIVKSEAVSTLKKYKASDKDANYIADAVGNAFVAHYSGDEDPALRPVINKSKLSLWGRIIYSQFRYALDGLWTDLPPEDNNAQFWL